MKDLKSKQKDAILSVSTLLVEHQDEINHEDARELDTWVAAVGATMLKGLQSWRLKNTLCQTSEADNQGEVAALRPDRFTTSTPSRMHF